jgi:hypothetical protein
MHDAGTSLWFDALCHKQTARVKRHLTLQDHARQKQDPGGRYTLEIRGHAPSQIALDDTPVELRKNEGAVGFRLSDWTYLAGS